MKIDTYDWQDVAEDLQNKLANAQYTINKLIDGNNKVNKENKRLKETIKEVTRILNSAKNHYGNDGKNWALERAIRILGGTNENNNI